MDVLKDSQMIRLVENLSDCLCSADMMKTLMDALYQNVRIENVIVLSAKENSYITIADSINTRIEHHYHFSEQLPDLSGNVVILKQLPELSRIWRSLCIEHGYSQLIFVTPTFGNYKGLFVLCPSSDQRLSQQHVIFLRRLMFVFRQLLVLLKQQYQLHKLATSNINHACSSDIRLKQFAERASEWFWETDLDNSFSYVSFDESPVRHSLSHLVGKTLFEIRSDRERTNEKKWKHIESLIRQRKPFYGFQFEILNEFKVAVWISMSGTPDYDNHANFTGFSGIGRDITASRQRELDLKQAKYDAEKASEAKSYFLATMSHEIRTPMNSIIGITELLQDTNLSRKQLGLVDFLRNSTELLLGVISDTLDFSKIESGTLSLDISRVNLHKLVKNMVTQFEVQATQKGLDFNYILGNGVPEYIAADGVRLSQVLMNLLGNAVKFTPSGSITLSINRSDSELLIAVTDTGVGVPSAEQKSLFQAFTQLHNKQAGRQQGVGLGLSISKRLLDLMKGRIACESDGKTGTTFHVSIPLDIDNFPSSVNNTSIQPSELKKISILVAEDNLANQMIIQAILEKRGYAVTIVENGQYAVEKVNEQSFDIILMDMNMPVLDGVAATKSIQRTHGVNAPPIIALTANAGVKDREACLAAGMRGVLTKPLNSQILHQRIIEALTKPH